MHMTILLQGRHSVKVCFRLYFYLDLNISEWCGTQKIRGAKSLIRLKKHSSRPSRNSRTFFLRVD